MKIQLERNSRLSSAQVRCNICEAACTHDRLRTLLCHDDGRIVGDICADCLHQSPTYIQTQLHQRAAKLIDRPLGNGNRWTPSLHKQALQLSELTHQPLTKPPFYAWWWKRLTILVAETRALEQARIGTANCQFRSDRPKNPRTAKIISD